MFRLFIKKFIKNHVFQYCLFVDILQKILIWKSKIRNKTSHCAWIEPPCWWFLVFCKFEGTLDSSKFWLVGVCCESQQDLESGKLKANIMEWYLGAHLLHGIFFVWPMEKAKDSVKLCPGAFEATHQHLSWNLMIPFYPTITKTYATN